MSAETTLIHPRDPATRLRPAAAADEIFVRRLFKAVRAEQFASANLPAELLDRLLEQQLRAQNAGYAARFPDAASLIVVHDEIPVGRLIVRASRDSWRVVDIALLPEAQGRGIGADLVEAMAGAAEQAGAGELNLSVRTANAAARRLYARLGFTEIGDDGAYVAMKRRLTAGAVNPACSP
ncbi:GNAT family N-acetyltransferase [Bradyrhizobium campsiandrae]|uniref:GNAT family N-acetyltransferase n=1 Tax=Bradyrhizobium campsiandrae TaxID=1729892 RepID=UPI001FCF02D8|nr:GNAT family N-acetyltransferase [Bradyrhizobium campsiandrae]